MRVLLVHNFYGSENPSGENRVVLEERGLLRADGHEVIEHFTHSDTVRSRGRFAQAAAGALVPWNASALDSLRRIVRGADPDVMHVHNVFPLLSPAIFGAAAGTRTAVVNTLHNYRTVCAAAIPLRNGAACTECIDARSSAPAIRHGCYRGSRLATLPVAAAVALHRRLGTYTRHVDAFIALTAFQRSVLAAGGLPAGRIHVKPNYHPGSPRPVEWNLREEKAVFLGRVSAEKGLDTLVAAWKLWGPAAPTLQIVGDGPDLDRLRREAQNARIVFTGGRTPSEAHDLLSTAKLLIVPSTWFEGFPLVLCEAFAYGVPIAASRLGTFEELVEAPRAGRLFRPGDPRSLLDTVTAMWSGPELERLGATARAEFESKYSASRNAEVLRHIYGHAVEFRQSRALGADSRPALVMGR